MAVVSSMTPFPNGRRFLVPWKREQSKPTKNRVESLRMPVRFPTITLKMEHVAGPVPIVKDAIKRPTIGADCVLDHEEDDLDQGLGGGLLPLGFMGGLPVPVGGAEAEHPVEEVGVDAGAGWWMSLMSRVRGLWSFFASRLGGK